MKDILHIADLAGGLEIEEDSFDHLPKSSAPGRILFEVFRLTPLELGNNFDLEVYDYDLDASTFWLNEGMGIEYFLDGVLDLELYGVYVMEGVTGEYIKGDGWMTDDDEDWYFETIRRATVAEILSGELG